MIQHLHPSNIRHGDGEMHTHPGEELMSEQHGTNRDDDYRVSAVNTEDKIAYEAGFRAGGKQALATPAREIDRIEERRPKPQIRYRLNVQYNVKGIRTTDATVELVGDLDSTEDGGAQQIKSFLELQVAFQKKVDNIYPPPQKDV